MTPETIIKLINKDYGINIVDKNRNQNYIFARNLYLCLCVELFYPKYNFTDIAKTVDRTHSTILHAIRKPKTLLFKKEFKKYLMIFDENRVELPEDDSTDKIIEIYQKRNEQLENEIVSLKINLQDLQETISKNKKETILNKLNEFDQYKKQELIKRFELIIDMESRKIYSFRDGLPTV